LGKSLYYLGLTLPRILLVCGLLLPIYGFWINPYFVELQPGHQHLYLGQSDPHAHASSNRKISLTNDHNSDFSIREFADSLSEGVICLLNLDMANLSFVVLAISYAALLKAHQNRLSFVWQPLFLRVASIFPPTVKHPPRFFVLH
jgi:hypothetical protein